MSERSSIDWTDATWNPVRGCTKVSLGCKFCYAETFAERFRGVPGHPFEYGFDLRLVQGKLSAPLSWRKPRRIFVNSMSDLFHEEVPDSFIFAVFDVIQRANWHTFQLLTKRAERLLSIAGELPWPPNLWLGVSIESHKYAFRSNLISDLPASIKFISAEPLLGPIPDLPLKGIDWLIAGGESGRSARPMDLSWVRNLRDQCKSAGVAFFLKQLGGRRNKRSGEQAVLDGQRWRELPAQISTPRTRM